VSDVFNAPAGSLPSFIQLADPDVNLRTLNPTLLQLLTVAGQIHAWLFHQVLVVTSGNDGTHASGSAHYQNRAVDLRTKDKTPVQQQLFLAVLTYLAEGRGAGVFDERQSKNGPHFHVELFA
jgi:hypothetical protein